MIYNGWKDYLGEIHYIFSIYLKDGRYKYEFTDFQHKGDGKDMPSYGSCLKMLNTTDKYFGIKMQKTYNVYLNQMHQNISENIESLKTIMALKSISTKEW